MRIVQFDANSGGTVTAYRKPAISDASTMMLMANSPSGMEGSSSRCTPLAASAISRCVSPAATAIATMVRCGALLVSVCHVKKKPACVSGFACGQPFGHSAKARAEARFGRGRPSPAREGGDCSTGTWRWRDTRPPAPTATPVARARQTAAAAPDRRPGWHHPVVWEIRRTRIGVGARPASRPRCVRRRSRSRPGTTARDEPAIEPASRLRPSRARRSFERSVPAAAP